MIDTAIQKESRAFEKIRTILPKNSRQISKPSGFDNAFPDFGYRVYIGDMRVNLYFEYKANYLAQMGWIRDWAFKNQQFSSNSALKADDKMQLLNIMNANREAITNANTMLEAFKKHYSSKVKDLSSSTLSVIEKDLRRINLMNFFNHISNFGITNINSNHLGNILIEYYARKFRSLVTTSTAKDYNVLFIMIDDSIWLISDDKPKLRSKILPLIFSGQINQLTNLDVQLEIRIQTKPGKEKIIKDPSVYIKGLDPMASYRLKRKPIGGLKII